MKSLVATLLLTSVACATDKGQFRASDPDIHQWVLGLKNNEGVGCCEAADGYEAREVEFDMNSRHYTVVIDGQIVEVPDKAVIHGPNKLGRAMEWHYTAWGHYYVRCFLPGPLF